MKESLSFIFSRRSIRKYQDKEISHETIRKLLEAAMASPSAVAKDPWRFIVLTEAQSKINVSQALPNGKMLASAPLGIIVCGDIDAAHGGELSYLLQDCSAAIENILLAANALDIGSCWLGVHPREDRVRFIKDYFRLPENIIPVAAIALGYKAEDKNPRTRYNEDFVHWEQW